MSMMQNIFEEEQQNDDTIKDQYLTFAIEDEDYGVEIAYVKEIIKMQAITKVPEMPNFIEGIINLRGDLIGQQQAVVKPMPKYFKKVHGLSGCTLLGNGDISLIIDVAGFFDK